jgi:hypothetical protein
VLDSNVVHVSLAVPEFDDELRVRLFLSCLISFTCALVWEDDQHCDGATYDESTGIVCAIKSDRSIGALCGDIQKRWQA